MQKLKIGKTTYNVEHVDTLEPPLTRGRIDYTARSIKIAKRAGQPRRKRSVKGAVHTLMHEVVHGILYEMGSRKYRDEVFVDELAKHIIQVMEQMTNDRT